MDKTGTLKIDFNTRISRLSSGPNDNKRLARQGEANELGAATDFLVDECGLSTEDFIRVTGSNGTSSSGLPVIFITNAVLAGAEAPVLTAFNAGGKKPGKAAAPAGGKKSKTASKSTAKKTGAKKSGGKKSSSKKSSAKKTGAKGQGARKSSGRKSSSKSSRKGQGKRK
jgi:hypothetical protein